MAHTKSAKEILFSKDFLEEQEKAAKHVRYEFQDYAYRLAADLGDLQHKAIYMRLAKNTDRLTLEQAAAFALGYINEPNKGKLFMWKLKKLKRQIQLGKDKKNFDHDFVMKKMAEVQNELADVYVVKQKRVFGENGREVLTRFVEEMNKLLFSKRKCKGKSLPAGQAGKGKETEGMKKARVLILGCGIGLECQYLSGMGLGIYGFDISRKLVSKAKKFAPKAKIICKKSFLENKYKDNFFDAIYCPRLWSIVPLESEAKYLREIMRVLKPEGVLYLHSEKGEDSQKWMEFEWQDENYIRFEKVNNVQKLDSRIKKAGFTGQKSIYINASSTL